MSIRILVDYNTVDERDRVEIHHEGQEELVSQLVHKMPIIVYDWDNLEFDAIAEYHEGVQGWYAIPDWATRRDLPSLSD